MQTFKLVAGRHIHGKDENGKQIVFKPGDTVKSEINLIERFGTDKFQLVDSKTLVSRSDPNDELAELTVRELRQYAEAEEIDVSTATKKSELIALITAAQGE